VEAKLFSVMNAVRSAKKRSTKFIHDVDLGMFMGGVIVGDDVDVETGRALLIDQLKKGEPFLMTVAGGQARDQFAFEIIECGEQEPAPAQAGVSVPCRT